jgi:hypothetical protein
MSWNIIKSQADVNYLNDLFDNFHDSYLKELCFSSGSYISVDHLMNENNEPIARFLFQRQWENPSIIEIEFRDVIQLNIKPEGKDEFTYISIAHLYFHDDVFFWSARDYEIHEDGKDAYTWVAAKQVKWRVRDGLLGNKKIYMPD